MTSCHSQRVPVANLDRKAKSSAQPLDMADVSPSSFPTRAGHSRSSPAEGPSSTTSMSPQDPAGGGTIEGANGPSNETTLQDPKEPLEEYDWEELEERFRESMDERQAAEAEIYKEFNALLAVR